MRLFPRREPEKSKLPDPANLIEGEHYYYKGEVKIYTAVYHVLKGYCCGNKCLHCPYISKKVK